MKTEFKKGDVIIPSETGPNGLHYPNGHWIVCAGFDIEKEAKLFNGGDCYDADLTDSKECQFWVWLKSIGYVQAVEPPHEVNITDALEGRKHED